MHVRCARARAARLRARSARALGAATAPLLLLLVAACVGNAPDPLAAAGPVQTGAAVVLPGAPHIIGVVPGDGHAIVTWTPPDPPDGGPVESYIISGDRGGTRSVPGETLTARVDGLQNGFSYGFTVSAVNADGFGPASEPSPPVLVAAAPSPPSGIAARAVDGGVRITWLVPEREGGSPVTGYRIEVDTNPPNGPPVAPGPFVIEGNAADGYSLVGDPAIATGPAISAEGATAFSIMLTGSGPGARYRVSARNAAGAGRFSGWSVPREVAQVVTSDAMPPVVSAAAPATTIDMSGSDGGLLAAPSPSDATAPTPAPLPTSTPVSSSPARPTPTPAASAPTPPATPGTPVTSPATATPAPRPPDVITVRWRESLFGLAGAPFRLHSLDARSTDPDDILRVDVDWGDGITDRAWFEDPVFISGRTAEGAGEIFGFHTYSAGGTYAVTVTVTAVNRDYLSGAVTLDVIING